jgi:hypothetical protein
VIQYSGRGRIRKKEEGRERIKEKDKDGGGWWRFKRVAGNKRCRRTFL